MQTATRTQIEEEIRSQANIRGLDDNLVLAIAKCESSLNPNALGTLAVVGVDKGLLQVNTYYHSKDMQRRGLDINDPDDSLEYGLDLMKSKGTQPWNASKKCWSRLQN